MHVATIWKNGIQLNIGDVGKHKACELITAGPDMIQTYWLKKLTVESQEAKRPVPKLGSGAEPSVETAVSFTQAFFIFAPKHKWRGKRDSVDTKHSNETDVRFMFKESSMEV